MGTRKVRLCMVLGGHWAAQMGGAQFQAKCLLELITARTDFETYYLAHAVPRQLKQPGYEIVPFHPAKIGGAFGLLAQLPSLYLKLLRLRPSVVYQRCLMPYTGACAVYCALSGAKFVYHVASDWDVHKGKFSGWGPSAMLHRVSRRFSEWGMRHADAIIVQTQEQARILREEFGLEATLIVPNVQPLPELPDRTIRRNLRRVVWVGNLKPVKNPELFVDLADAFRDTPGVRFVMIGDRGETARYAQLHQRMKQTPNLDYLGELPVERAEAEIAASDILVNTSSTEGFPNTFIQAWLRGVPVVSCYVDPDGCLTRGGAGIRAGDPKRLAEVIGQLLDDAQSLKKLGQSALQYGRENHAPARAQGLIELLAHQEGNNV